MCECVIVFIFHFIQIMFLRLVRVLYVMLYIAMAYMYKNDICFDGKMIHQYVLVVFVIVVEGAGQTKQSAPAT